MTAAAAGVATVLWASAVAGTPLAHEQALLLTVAGLITVEMLVTKPCGAGLTAVGLAILLAFSGEHWIGMTVLLAAVVWNELSMRAAFFTDRASPCR